MTLRKLLLANRLPQTAGTSSPCQTGLSPVGVRVVIQQVGWLRKLAHLLETNEINNSTFEIPFLTFTTMGKTMLDLGMEQRRRLRQVSHSPELRPSRPGARTAEQFRLCHLHFASEFLLDNRAAP